jgi:radical SAM superfamily enzyme YgiQ (UPF0313 family)
MKVLLTNPPWKRPGWYGVRAGSRWPHLERAESPYMPFPFLLAYTAAVLEADGVEVEVIDACAERMDLGEFLERFEAADPDVVVAETSTPSLHGDMRTFAAMREAGFEGPILLGGLHKQLYEPAFLDTAPLISGTLVGEYEYTVREFVRTGGTPKEALAGLIWRTPDGILDGGRKPSQDGLDSIPWPARHLFPMDDYHDLPGGIPSPSVQMWGSRGCSFTCSFCAWPQILYADNLYRTRSAEAVADEMVAMYQQGYKSVYFDDDTFNLGKRRTEELTIAFADRGLQMPWAFMGRADTCDPAQYEALAKTGLKAVKYGVESADSARLKQIGKNLDLDRVREAVRAVKALGIKTHLTFMFGLQGETLDTMQRTLDLAYELDPDSAQFTIAVPFPGSRLHDELKADGRLDGLEFEDLDGYRTGVVSTDALEAEQIIAFVHGVHRRWEKRSRPAGVAPKIPITEIGGSTVSVGLLARAGDADWLVAALTAVAAQEGPSREIVIVADRSDPALMTAAAETCNQATFLDAEPGESPGAMANRIPDACTGLWIALLQGGVVPRPGWLKALIDAAAAHPDAGAVACPLGDGTSALEVTRWGRVLPRRGATDDGAQVLAVSSQVGLFSRALLEDVGGFDPELPAELADADLALRGLLMGYRSVFAAGAGVDAPDDLPLIAEDGPATAEAARAWGRGRLRMLLKSVPREAWQEAGPALAIELVADIYRAARGRRHPASVLLGMLDGLSDGRRSVADRRTALGRRRVGERWVLSAFAASEQDITDHCSWQRSLSRVTS